MRRINIDSGNEPQFLGWPKKKSPNLPRPDFLNNAIIIIFTYLVKRCQILDSQKDRQDEKAEGYIQDEGTR